MDESYNTVTTNLGALSTNMYDYMNSILSNPSIIIIIVIVLVVYITIFFSLGGSGSSDTTSSSSGSFNLFGSSSSTDSGSSSGSSSIMLGVIIAAIVIVLIMINALQNFFGIDIIAKVKNLFTGNPEVDITNDPVAVSGSAPEDEIMRSPQGFNIPGND
jgi:hypothetical protein